MTKRPEHINLHLLPTQVKMLVRLIGEAATWKLLEARGGSRIVVPRSCTPDHWLNEVLGPKAFAALVSSAELLLLELPKYDSVMRQWRHQQVQALCRKGMTYNQVALRTGYSRRHVINIRQDEREASQQWDLFDPPAAAARQAAPAEPGATVHHAHDPFGLQVRRGAEVDGGDAAESL